MRANRHDSSIMMRFRMPLAGSLLCANLVACGTEQTVLAGQVDSAAARATRAMGTWNAIALATTAAGPFSPPRETRVMAMVSAAVFDAVSSIRRDHTPYAVRVDVRGNASIEAAVTAAAHAVLVALYPAAKSSLDASRDSALARISPGRARDDGVAAGESVAAAVLSARSGDRALDAANYTPGSGVGAWVPAPPGFGTALEPGWGRVAPFFMDSGSQFRPGPPPAVGSATYVRDYVEVITIGAARSKERQSVQTESARFWVVPAAQLWNPLVRQLTVARRLDPSTAARAYLLLNLAGADAIIAAWEAKFAYNQWRPVTAIRSLADDGAPTTKTDTTWSPLLATPPFPDYPAGHTSYGGAAERVLSALFGEKPGELALTSPSLAGVTHRYQSFGEIAEEVTNARVWAGVHWRTSSTVGRTLGRTVADLALARAPRRIE